MKVLPEINSDNFFLKKRDGHIVSYNKNKILKVLQNISDMFKEISPESLENLAFIIDKKIKNLLLSEKEIIFTETISNIIEEILKEKGFYLSARAYVGFHNYREKNKQNLKIKVFNEDFKDTTDMSLMVVNEASSNYRTWDKTRIIKALLRETDIDSNKAYEVADKVEKKIIDSGIKQLTTSLIREMVDIELFDMGLEKKLSKQKSLGIPIYNLEQIIFSKTLENSNISSNNPEAVNLSIAENILKQYALSSIFSKEISEAHIKGRIHLHDLGYPTRVYCSSHSLEYIKKYGLNLENLNIISSPAKHSQTLTGHINTFLASMQAYYAGALGLANVNVSYAPYLVGKTYNELVQESQYLIYSCAQNAFSRGGQTLFIDFNIHTGIPDYMKKLPAIGPGGKYTGKVYGDYEKEAQNFAMALMEVWKKGDANGYVFEFPKMDLHINQETFDDPKQYEILKFACQISSENGSPYFIFDRDSITLSACCRLRTTFNMSDERDKMMIEHPETMRYCGFQNITINLPQAAYRSGKNNINGTIQDILESMDMCVKAHFEKRKFVEKLMKTKGFPLWQIGKPSMDGYPYVDLDRASYIIGMIGLNECVKYLTGKELHEDDESFKLGLKIVTSMFIKIQELSKKYNLKFVLEESPAESASRRLAKIDLKEYPFSKDYIKGDISNDSCYYTNSIHFAPEIDIPIVERIKKQSKFHSLIAAGAIIHAFIGEEKPSSTSILNLITKTWKNTNCAQLTISPEFTICNSCKKMTRGFFNKCENCGAENIFGVKEI